MTAPVAGARVFRPPLGRRIIGALLISIVLSTIVGTIVPRLLPVTTPRGDRAGLALVAIAVVLLLTWGMALWWTNLRVIVTDDTVEVHRPGMRLHVWARDATRFRSTITKRYVNGIPSGTARTLIADGPGRSDEVAVPLGREDFTRLIALLSPLAPPAAGDRETSSTTDARVFQPDATPLRTRTTRLTVGAAVALVATFAALGLVASGIVARGDLTSVTLVAAICALITVTLAVLAAVMLGRARRVPSRIELTPGFLTVDGHSFDCARMRAIRLSPPAYPVRRMAIVDETGRTHRWLLGEHLSPRGGQLLPEYPELVAAVAESARGTEGIVLFDLR